MLYPNYSADKNGHFLLAGVDTTDLCKKYGTPLYLIDENRIRENCRTYHRALKKNFGENGYGVLYASKALSFKKIYSLASEEKMLVDVVSMGEIQTALLGGFPASDIYFHGNVKTDAEIEFAIGVGIGSFMLDSMEEIDSVDYFAGKKGIVQNVIFRVTPGIDPNTYEAINTGKIDSKFGTPVSNGDALELTKYILGKKNLRLIGFHCHIGSQIFSSEPFTNAAAVMADFLCLVKNTLGYTADILDLGGGIGVRYVDSDPMLDIEKCIDDIADKIKEIFISASYPLPKIFLEPGRSLVAESGVTLYNVENVKEIAGYKNYVAVDGGMTDNPRYALYKADYTLLLANRMLDKADFLCSVVGRCCESGDIIQESVLLPKPKKNDILCVLVTGAYNYTMSSNYNGITRLPVVMIRDKKDTLTVRRENHADMIKCQL